MGFGLGEVLVFLLVMKDIVIMLVMVGFYIFLELLLYVIGESVKVEMMLLEYWDLLGGLNVD